MMMSVLDRRVLCQPIGSLLPTVVLPVVPPQCCCPVCLLCQFTVHSVLESQYLPSALLSPVKIRALRSE